MTSSPGPLASVVIDNFNYGCFLGDAIASGLCQTYPRTEVIVVDDGSTDDSREVIDAYAGRIAAVYKENGGQASAINRGFMESRGEVVCFLDADDALLPTAVERAVDALRDADAAKVHWPLSVVDRNGNPTGQVHCPNLPEGDIRERLVREGPPRSLSPPMSGNAWPRSFLEAVLPIPEDEFPINADCFLYTLAAAYGPLRVIPDPQALYRIHGDNLYESKTFRGRLSVGLRDYERQCQALERFLDPDGGIDSRAWRASSWWHRVSACLRDIEAIVPAGGAVVLVDDGAWELDKTDGWRPDGAVAGRRCIPFVERNGRWWGRPADGAAAIAELERLRSGGTDFAAFVWPAFWWLEHYDDLREHLRRSSRRVLDNDRLVLFDLRPNEDAWA